VRYYALAAVLVLALFALIRPLCVRAAGADGLLDVRGALADRAHDMRMYPEDFAEIM
jgi:hypothetical protein